MKQIFEKAHEINKALLELVELVPPQNEDEYDSDEKALLMYLAHIGVYMHHFLVKLRDMHGKNLKDSAHVN